MKTTISFPRRTLLGGAAALIAGLATAPAFAQAARPLLVTAEKVTLYKDPNCGCCQGYAEFLKANDFEVEVIPTDDLWQLSADAGIPEDFAGCHLFNIGDYAFSGHIPLATLTKFLTERPAMIGLTVPGMPMGAPGMGGEKMEPLEILALQTGQAPTVYAVE
mgnify:FL=1